ncbi:MAG TPA: hemin uptake protein HemP [Planctomycetes bacterium]|nr:hemin uptake protein HemP [Planctomycetota bacterium]
MGRSTNREGRFVDEPRDEGAANECRDISDHQASPEVQADADEVKVWNSQQLLGSGREAVILHGSQVYRLLCTRNGKLILQK